MIEVGDMRDVHVLESRALVCLDDLGLLRPPSCIHWVLDDGAKLSKGVLSQRLHQEVQVWRIYVRQHSESETRASSRDFDDEKAISRRVPVLVKEAQRWRMVSPESGLEMPRHQSAERENASSIYDASDTTLSGDDDTSLIIRNIINMSSFIK
jgi:hypothetical protein